MVQTLLVDDQVAELVAAYVAGATMSELSKRFCIHRRTVVAHLVRQSVPLRHRGLAPEHVNEAVRLYEAGSSLMEIGLRFGASAGAVRRVLVDRGVKMRTPWQHMQKSTSARRTHLYKLLDRGEIMSHRVGRDRRIRVRDLLEFEAQRQRDRRELAERFAHQQTTRAGAIDEVADLL